MSDKKKKQQNKRKPPWILGGIVLILFTVLVLLQSSNIWKNISVDSARETLLLYALSSLNFIAFIIFAFILIRSLLKLRQERRSLQLGSKIKTRLLFYFAAVSILPLIAMFVFSYLFMNRALERWFTQIPENVVRRTAEENLNIIKRTAPLLAKSIEGREINDQDLEKIVNAGDLLRLDVRSKENVLITQAKKSTAESYNSEINFAILNYEKYLEDEETNFLNREFDVTKVNLLDGKSLYVVFDLRSSGSIGQLAKQSLNEFDRLKSQDKLFRQIGLTTLGLLTFLLIFASTWTAFYIGKTLTRPIRALAEGADKIAKGDYAHRVDTFAEDELEILVNSFNVMSSKLEENSDELESRRKYIETVLQSLSTGVISFDGENHITTINKAAKQIFRLDDADFTNSKLEELVKEENYQVLVKLIMRAKRIGQATEQTTLQREYNDGNAESGENLPVALTASALPNEDGVVLVIEDLTELITAQRASAWQEVARRMAHEIKNPLTPIQLSAERIAKNFHRNSSFPNRQPSVIEKLVNINDENKDQRTTGNGQMTKIVDESTETILREVLTLKSMVDEFSRYARLPDVKLSEGDINEIIRQSTLLYEDRIDKVKIESELLVDLPKTLIDAEQLKRVFVNLIDNAYEAFEVSNANKTIKIKTFHDSARDIIVAEVSDNGKGIEPSGFQKLFQPYFSTKGRGTGLGLAIVQRIISEHGGKIKAVANTPKGAKFIVELPINV